jgi:hypothetical protein
MTPRRLQRSRRQGSTLPPDAVCVTRPGPWGNPFGIVPKLGGWGILYTHAGVHDHPECWPGTATYPRKRAAAQAAVDLYAKWAPEHIDGQRAVDTLAGRDLACWCPLTDADGTPWPCHADALLRLANGGAA